jgi:hypothetical protein
MKFPVVSLVTSIIKVVALKNVVVMLTSQSDMNIFSVLDVAKLSIKVQLEIVVGAD